MVRAPGELFIGPIINLIVDPSTRPKLAACLTILLVCVGLLAPLAAQDGIPNNAASKPCIERSAASPESRPGQTVRSAGDSAHAAPGANPDRAAEPAASAADCLPPSPVPQAPRNFTSNLRSSSSSYFSSNALADATYSQNAGAADLIGPAAQLSVSTKTGKWGGEQWEPALLQTLGFTLAQNGYRYVTEEKTRRAIDEETWGRYWLAVTGLHTWSDGGKTWTVYVAHPVQGAIFSDIWTEHDPHGALVPFGLSHAYWTSRFKAFWWNAAWELQWKFGPFSEASIGNVGLIPGKLGANTIVSTVTIGTGLAIAEDVADRYAIAKWERKTENRAARGLLRTFLNPDRSFANLFRKKYPWYRDTRPTLRDVEPD